MLRLAVLSVLAVLCAAGYASAHGAGKCPLIVPGKYPFDPEKFQGEWKLAAACPTTMDVKGKCGKYSIVYQKSEGKEFTSVGLTSRFSGLSSKDGSSKNLEFLSSGKNVGGKPGGAKMAVGYSVYRPEGTGAFSGVFKESIIATDYDNYALYLACKPEFDGEKKMFGRTMFAEIWSRPGVTLSKDRLDTLINILSSYDIDQADIKVVDSQC